MTILTNAVPIPAIAGTPDTAVAPVQLLTWQNVPASELVQHAPDRSLPMGRYAVATVMAWAQAQGHPGAIPTWEIGRDNAGDVWGVFLIHEHPAIRTVSIPTAELPGWDPSNPALWGQAVMRWGTARGYPLTIATFLEDAGGVTALAFESGYPGLSYYEAPNMQLFQSQGQARKVIDLMDPAVWANSVMRVAGQRGFAAGWPTWECTTSRGMWGMAASAYPVLPDATQQNVANVLTILTRTVDTVNGATTESLADFSGIYGTFAAAPVTDPGLRILIDCLFGAVDAALNLIPDVGGALASLLSTAMQVAQDAAKSQGGNGPITLETYQKMLSAASDATATYIAQLHDTLMNASASGTLQQVWAQTYLNPLGGPPAQLGMLAYASNDMVNGDVFWNTMREQIAASMNLNLQVSITSQLYTVVRRTYQNAPTNHQWWYGSVADVTAPNGPMANYIASEDDERSVWFTDCVQESDYVTATMFWLQAGNTFPSEYPPTSLCYALFSGDGFGDTGTWGYTGTFSKSKVYNWLMATVELGNGDSTGQQRWTYDTGGNIVTANILSESGVVTSVNSAWTDANGIVHLNTADPTVQWANQEFGFEQQVIINYLSPLN
jgi:hypothetical protein